MKHAAIPTLYNGVQFRSRLEARWAAFFDLCKWKWEYEPIDLNGWIPDFRVVARFGAPYLCEVKPVTFGDAPDLLDATTNEMTVALGGVQPPLGKDFHDIMIAGTNLDSWWTAWVWYDDGKCSTLLQMLGEDRIDAKLRSDLNSLWKQAGNTVQWKRPT
jgi:hypothetical protein